MQIAGGFVRQNQLGTLNHRPRDAHKLLLTAENFDFSYQAGRHESLSSGPDPVYTYVVDTPSGIFSYSDDSPHQGSTLRQLQGWVLTVVRKVC